jgi:membrane peptidoglycan carboxypeptidase
VKAPSAFDPATDKGRPLALGRREYVLDQMIKMKQITEAQRDEALKAELKIYRNRAPRDCNEAQHPELGAGFFCDYLVRWWKQQTAFGADPYERENRLRSGGYTIISSLDIATQTAAFAQVQHQSGDFPKSKQVGMDSSLALMLAAVVPGKGYVNALAMNRTFSNDETNNGPNTNPDKPGLKGNYPNTSVPFITGGPDVPGYQGGSTFKIFTLAAALEKGYPLNFTLKAEERAKTKYVIEEGEPAACPGTKYYCPGNASSGEAGVYNMWSAFGKSVNTFFVPLEEQVSSNAAANMAARAGITFNGNPQRKPDGTCESDSDACRALANDWGAFTLGVADVTPLELANAYATFAADGVACQSTPVIEIHDKDGKKVDGADPQCKAQISPDVAHGAIDAARCPIGDRSSTSQCTGGTASATRGIVNKPIAGKTGTTDNEKNAILVATTPHLAVAGFLTDPDNPQHAKHMSHDPVNNAVAYTLRDATANDPADNFTPPSDKIINGNQLGIPDLHCAEVGAAKSALRRAGFDPQVAPAPVTSDKQGPQGRRCHDQHQQRQRATRPAARSAGPTPPHKARPGTRWWWAG